MSANAFSPKKAQPFTDDSANSDSERNPSTSSPVSSYRLPLVMGGLFLTVLCGAGATYGLLSRQSETSNETGRDVTVPMSNTPIESSAGASQGPGQDPSSPTPSAGIGSVLKEDAFEPWDLSKLWTNLRSEVALSGDAQNKKHFAILLQSGKYNPPHQGHIQALKNAKTELEREDQEVAISTTDAKASAEVCHYERVPMRVVGAFMSPIHDKHVQAERQSWAGHLALTAPLRRILIREMTRSDPLVALGRWESLGLTGSSEAENVFYMSDPDTKCEMHYTNSLDLDTQDIDKWIQEKGIRGNDSSEQTEIAVLQNLVENVRYAIQTREDLSDLRQLNVGERLVFHIVQGGDVQVLGDHSDARVEQLQSVSLHKPLRPTVVVPREMDVKAGSTYQVASPVAEFRNLSSTQLRSRMTCFGSGETAGFFSNEDSSCAALSAKGSRYFQSTMGQPVFSTLEALFKWYEDAEKMRHDLLQCYFNKMTPFGLDIGNFLFYSELQSTRGLPPHQYNYFIRARGKKEATWKINVAYGYPPTIPSQAVNERIAVSKPEGMPVDNADIKPEDKRTTRNSKAMMLAKASDQVSSFISINKNAQRKQSGSYHRMTMDLSFREIDGNAIADATTFLQLHDNNSLTEKMVCKGRMANYYKHVVNKDVKLEPYYREELIKIMDGTGGRCNENFNDIRQALFYLWTLQQPATGPSNPKMPSNYPITSCHYHYMTSALNADDPDKLKHCGGYLKCLMHAFKSLCKHQKPGPVIGNKYKKYMLSAASYGSCKFDKNVDRKTKAPTTSTVVRAS